MTRGAKNVVRDVLYGCWCAGKRIGGASTPPFPLIQLATILARDGRDVTFLDAQAEQKGPGEVAGLVKRFDVVLCSTSTMSFTEDAAYLAGLKAANPDLVTIVFGSHPTFMPLYALAAEGVDYIVRREPEYVVRDLCRGLAGEGDPRAVPGAGFRDGEGRARVNPDYPFIENLDELPYPDVDFLPQGLHYFNPIVRRLPYMTATTSRGCPGKCTFCTAPAFDGGRVRFASSGYVLGLMRYLLSKGFREVYFRDDTFFVNKRRDREIFEGILKEKLDVTWLANARVSGIDAGTMEAAGKAGCHTIKFGIESGSQAILDGMRKGYRLEQAHDIFRAARRMGMNTHAHVMLGNPGDTVKSIEDTIEFVKRLAPTTATFGICTPYPGTPLFEAVAEKHPEIKDGTSSDLSKLHVEGLFNALYCDVTGAELNRLVRRAYRSFYLRPGCLLNLAARQVRSLGDLKRCLIAGSRVLDFICRGA
jgi:radical SAM superfamily enzyme YgiQ (UPF0313 family)